MRIAEPVSESCARNGEEGPGSQQLVFELDGNHRCSGGREDDPPGPRNGDVFGELFALSSRARLLDLPGFPRNVS